MQPQNYIILSTVILLLPLLSFLVLIFFGKKIGRPSGIIGTSLLGINLLLSIYMLVEKFGENFHDYLWVSEGKMFTILADQGMIQLKMTWFTVADMTFQLGIGIDNLAATMLIIVMLISFLVHLFSWDYMEGDPRFSRFYAYLGIFTFSMIGIVIANNLLNMYIFWELVGLSSYLLIGFWFEKDTAADASKKAFLTNRIGDLGFFIGIMILFSTFGTFMFDEIWAGLKSGIIPFDSTTFLTAAGILIFCGAIGKSAQFPLHVWLPDAMEGPTPVSALIHAATMVAAGVYMVARVFPLYTADALTFIAYTGAFTALMTATIAVTQNDFKRVLAYSTVSQLGFMVMALGVGAYTTGYFHLMTHAWFKGALFLASGSVIYAMHKACDVTHNHHMDAQDINNMGGLRKKMPWTYGTFLIVTLALSGVPLTSGFLSKDGILAGTLAFGQLTGHWMVPISGFIAAGLTAFYMFRLTIVSFHGKPKTEEAKQTKENRWVIVFPLVLLSVMSLFFLYSPDPTNAHAGWFYEKIQMPETAVPHDVQWDFLLMNDQPDAAHGVETHGAEAEHGAVHHYINKFQEQMHHAHLPAMILSILIAGAGILFAFLLYQFKIFNADKLAGQFKLLHKISFNKWYFDEIYQKSFIGGTVGVSKILAIFDLKVIDGLVNLTALLTRGFSYFIGHFDNIVIDGTVNLLANATGLFSTVLRKVQTGSVQTYIIFVIISLMVLIYLVV